MSCWRAVPGGIELFVRLTPKAGRDRIDGIAADADGRQYLAVRVAAAPVEGAANAGLISFLAKSWRLPKSAFSLVSGETQRLKRLSVSCDAVALARLLPDLEEGS